MSTLRHCQESFHLTRQYYTALRFSFLCLLIVDKMLSKYSWLCYMYIMFICSYVQSKCAFGLCSACNLYTSWMRLRFSLYIRPYISIHLFICLFIYLFVKLSHLAGIFMSRVLVLNPD